MTVLMFFVHLHPDEAAEPRKLGFYAIPFFKTIKSTNLGANLFLFAMKSPSILPCVTLNFFVYRSPSSDSEVFEVLSTTIDSLLQKCPAAEVTVYGDFNVHNREWFILLFILVALRLQVWQLKYLHCVTA